MWVALLATVGLSVYALFYTDVFFLDFLVPFTGEESYAAFLEGSIFVKILDNAMYGDITSLNNAQTKTHTFSCLPDQLALQPPRFQIGLN